jgi:CBS domain-containing protein
MSSDPMTVRRTDVVGPLRDTMLTRHVHGVPVLDADGTLAGIVTSSDLVEEWSPAQGVETVMTRRVTTVGPGTTLTEAAREMLGAGIHHLVVVDNTRVVGVVSSFDLLRALVDDVESSVTPTVGAVAERPAARVGDTVVIRSHAVGRERRGRIVATRGRDGGPPYLVRWADDPHDEPHEVLFFPGPDADVEPAQE